MHNVGEGGPLLEAQSPAASHELVDSGGTSIGGGELQLPRLQTWTEKEKRREGWGEIAVKCSCQVVLLKSRFF